MIYYSLGSRIILISYLSSFLSEPSCIDGHCPAFYKPYLAFADDSNPNAVGIELLYLGIDSLLYISIIFLVEYGLFAILFEHIKKIVYSLITRFFPGPHETSRALDNDVMNEQDRVDGQVAGNTLLILLNIMFLHRWEDFTVDNVVITTKGLQDRNIHILDGTTVENKGKLILILYYF